MPFQVSCHSSIQSFEIYGKKLSVHRDDVTEEMLELYAADSSILFKQLKVNFIGETGDDFGGLTKHVFTSLWVDIIWQFFIGETAVVPFIPVHKHMQKRRHFEAIGRILAHTVALLQYVPARLS